MRVLCAFSGIEFEASHVPGFLSSREAFHPVFSLSPHRILNYAGKWSAGQLTPTDSYLLFLAGLHSTELIDWRVPVQQSAKTHSIVAHNMPKLFSVLAKLDVIKNPSFATPRYAITPETKTLDNVRYWIEAWLDSYVQFQDGYKSISLNQQIMRKEAALERLIKSKHKSVSSYSAMLADWACLAGDFPTFQTSITTKIGEEVKQLTCAEYWKQIIIQVGRKEALWKLNVKDLEELIEHCEDNIDAGTIYSYTLMSYLRGALEEIKNPFGFGGPKGTPFTILDDGDSSVEKANLLAVVLGAPENLPKPSDYATKFEYLKAKMAYDLAQKHKPKSPESETPDSKFDI